MKSELEVPKTETCDAHRDIRFLALPNPDAELVVSLHILIANYRELGATDAGISAAINWISEMQKHTNPR